MEGARESTDDYYQTCYTLKCSKAFRIKITQRGYLEVIKDDIKGAYSKRLSILSGWTEGG